VCRVAGLADRRHTRYRERDGQAVFFTPSGKALFEVPPLPELPADPVEALVRRNHGREVMPDAYGLTNRWRWDRDVPWATGRPPLQPRP
jgi:hypothetical protein